MPSHSFMPVPPKLLHNAHCGLGENPLWDPAEACLYWTDIHGGKVHQLNPATGGHRIVYDDELVGGFTLQSNGDLLLFRTADVALLKPGGCVEVVARFRDEGMERFNDVIADPLGRVFAGTIGSSEQSGGLYRMDHDGRMTLLFRGTGCSNGMGFSPDRRTFYWTCSTTRRIHSFDYAQESGVLGNRRVLYECVADEGIPDGMTVDSSGHIWSARWDGSALIHHDPSGRVIESIPLPVTKVSSACFGGKEMDRLYVTTAGGKEGTDTEDGAIFELVTGARGPAEFRSRIDC
ncbi:MAG: SMP-30/gluconolactonase/LRE family protein [Rhodobacteraceae bacterium]|nr:SMP-30/gluconolactonase/LRE family protein [Paracoccaceae bacterium]